MPYMLEILLDYSPTPAAAASSRKGGTVVVKQVPLVIFF
jgi:hypothetical protein